MLRLALALALLSRLASGLLSKRSVKFHHFEFNCADVLTTSLRFQHGLGLAPIAGLGVATGCAPGLESRVLGSGDLCFAFTSAFDGVQATAEAPEGAALSAGDWIDRDATRRYVGKHGLGVRAVALEVDGVKEAFRDAVDRGAVPVKAPVRLEDSNGVADVAELQLYGDTVLRLVDSSAYGGAFLPGYEGRGAGGAAEDFGLLRCDHCVGNVDDLASARSYLSTLSGFHDFAEFDHADVGTVNSGLNSVVLANEDERVLLPLNEPVRDTPRVSQIQTYLDWHGGAGVQHLALFSRDIGETVSRIRASGMFEFMDHPGRAYYENTRRRIREGEDYVDAAKQLPEAVWDMAEANGVLVDADDEGVLLQIFTKPVGDRPTFFFEIIQRVGCSTTGREQKPGCGGFGKGNFRELFKQIEDYEEELFKVAR